MRELPIQHRLAAVIFRKGQDDVKSGIAPEQRERKMSRWAVYLGASRTCCHPNPSLCCHIHPPSQHTVRVRNNNFGLVRWCSGERVSGPDNPSSIPETHKWKERTQLLTICLLTTKCTPQDQHTHTVKNK